MQPQRVLVHLVERTHASMHHRRVEISMARHCEPCARLLLEKGCPLSVVPLATFCAEWRVRCEAAADAPAPNPSQRHAGAVYRRGQVLLHVLPGMRPLLINPRERPCVLCGTDERRGRRDPHADTCPCVNVESVPEWHE